MAYLNGNTRIIAVGGKQVNADWNETNPLSPAYIQNKPDITGALTRQIVDELPVTDIDPNCIYMVLKSDPVTGDYYDEFMYIDDNWEQIGSTQVAQVQSDWDESDPTSPAYIDNKPTIPTAVSELTNDEGYITINDVPAQVQSDWDESDPTSPAYIDNKPDTLDFIVPFTEVNDVISTTVAKADIVAAINAGKTVRATLNGQFYELVAYKASPEKMSFAAVIEDTTVSIIGKIVNDNWTWESYDTELNVQADWNEADADSPAYINNKPTLATVATSGDYTDLSNTPTIPTVNDATITIQQNGTTVGTFTTNDADDTTINLTGGGGDAWYGTQEEFDALEATGQLQEETNYYIEGELARVATTGQYADLKGAKPSAPVAFSNKYHDLTGTPTPLQTVVTGRAEADWHGTQAEFDALEQAGQLNWYTNYYIEGEGGGNEHQQEEVQDFLPLYLENISDSDITVILRGVKASSPYNYDPPVINLSTSNDNDTWTALTIPTSGDVNITVPANGRTYLKGNNNYFCQMYGNLSYPNPAYWMFDLTSYDYTPYIYVGGNLMSLLKGDTFLTDLNTTVTLPEFCFGNLFNFQSNYGKIRNFSKMTCNLPRNLDNYGNLQLSSLNYAFYNIFASEDALDLSNITVTNSSVVSITGNNNQKSVKNVIGDYSSYYSNRDIYNSSNVGFKGGAGVVDYDLLRNKPTIPAAQVNSDWSASSGVSQILNKPSNLVTGYNGASYTIRYISQTDYDNLGTYDANTIYLIY